MEARDKKRCKKLDEMLGRGLFSDYLTPAMDAYQIT